MRKIFHSIILVVFCSCTATQINNTLSGVNDMLGGGSQLSSEEVANGLKAALEKGISKGSDQASQTDGYFKNPKLKIPFPAEVQKVEDKLRQLGMGNLVDDFVLSLNRGAEKAANEAKPIFVDAIRGMSIQDAWGILKGENDAATVYLKENTSSKLYDKFKPVIQNSLESVNATKYYSDMINAYNKIPFVEKVNPNLDDYATNKAIDGLFVLIKEEEANIRENPSARTTEILKRVFSQQD